jgi:hypothetical protein
MSKQELVTENCIIVRKNDIITQGINELWWQEYSTGSCRDQVSMPYVLWRLGVKPNYFRFHSRKNKYYRNWGEHLKSNRVCNGTKQIL